MTQEGIPGLYKIPYLGSLFGFEREVTRKIELLFLITPHVIQTLEEAELVTQEFKEKVKGLKELLQPQEFKDKAKGKIQDLLKLK